MFSTITTAPSTTMPKSSAPSDSRFAGMCRRSRQIEANSSENGMVSATISAPRAFPRNRNRMIDHQNDAFGQVVQHRVRGVVHQIAAVEKRNDLHAPRQDVIVQLVHLVVDAVQRASESAPLRSSTMPSTTSLSSSTTSVSAVNGPADLPQPDLWPLRHRGDVPHADGRAVLRLEDSVCSMSADSRSPIPRRAR